MLMKKRRCYKKNKRIKNLRTPANDKSNNAEMEPEKKCNT